MARFGIKRASGVFWRGFETVTPDYNYHFNDRLMSVWGSEQQATVFPSESSARLTIRNIAAFDVSIVPLEDSTNG
jgi:hypothetical protein